MTQYFAYQRFKLWRAPLPTRVLLTLFSLMIVVATAISILAYQIRTGLTVQGTTAWYRGNENVTGATEMLFPRTLREMLDVTHPHAFEQSFLFFVLAHIFALTAASDRTKVAVYITAFGTVAIDLAIPYLIRFGSPAFSPVQPVNAFVMTAVLLVLIAVPLYEMWLYRPVEDASAG